MLISCLSLLGYYLTEVYLNAKIEKGMDNIYYIRITNIITLSLY